MMMMMMMMMMTAASRIGAVHLLVRLLVCLSVCRQNAKKLDFLKN